MDLELARNFLIALAIGALIGIEREKKKGTEPGPSLGGVRTHILLALLGAASAWLARELAVAWIFVVVLAAVSVAVITSYWLQNRESGEAPGLTSEVAAIAVCLLGGMAIVGNVGLAVALAVVTSAVLAYKEPLHGLVERIGTEDIFAGIKLLIASFIVLPLLPDVAIDPWDAIVPSQLWLLVILISGLSLVGYVAVRWLGAAQGTAVTGVAGGLVSSTATTLSFARASHSEQEAGKGDALSAGILFAWLVMFVRTMVLVAIINRALLTSVWIPFACMGLVTAAFAGWHYRASLVDPAVTEQKEVAVSNPFSLSSAIRFGALFAFVLLVVKLAQNYYPGVGVYVVSALAGSVDVDAITLSIAKDTAPSSNLVQAGIALVIAALSNTIVKCGLVVTLGKGALRRQIVVATAAIMASGLLASWYLIA
jgi:uncharacterized membrane protein (DUF4010 family)